MAWGYENVATGRGVQTSCCACADCIPVSIAIPIVPIAIAIRRIIAIVFVCAIVCPLRQLDANKYFEDIVAHYHKIFKIIYKRMTKHGYKEGVSINRIFASIHYSIS